MTERTDALDRQVDEVDRKRGQEAPFNFVEHRRAAVEEYRRVRPRYEDFASAVKEILVRWTPLLRQHEG